MLSTAQPTLIPFTEPSTFPVKTQTIAYKPLHPTFAAEASGVDFNSVTREVVDEIKAGLAKVGHNRW